MDLIIDGKRAALKRGSSFDYVSENRAFTDADDYTLSITLPLAGCAQNLAIFGHVERMDCDSRRIVKEASIVDHAFTKNGVITVVEANEKEVKCQFLANRSYQNFNTTFDEIYINELDLGCYPETTLPANVFYGDIGQGYTCVPLPWVNDSADGFMNNEVIVQNGKYKWADSTKSVGKLSYMPYLIYIAEQICRDRGYTYDFSEWMNSDERYLLICNALPASWDLPQFARALPHWSVSEFFAELENILLCEFDLDHRIRHIGFQFTKNISSIARVVKLDKVVDTFSSEVSYDDSIAQYKGLANIRYADRGDDLWRLQQCQWLVDELKQNGRHYLEFKTEKDFEQWRMLNGMAFDWMGVEKNAERPAWMNSLIHILDPDRFLLTKVSAFKPKNAPEFAVAQMFDVNQFGGVSNLDDSADDIELQCVPVRIDETDFEHGLCIFLSPSGWSEDECVDDDGVRQPIAYSLFKRGEHKDTPTYYDHLLLAYWDGHSCNQAVASQENILPPCPYADERFSLKKRYANYLGGLTINPREKLKVSFISSAIPDVRSVFFIRGKKYLCEKISATITENGMSQLLKGEFYPLKNRREIWLSAKLVVALQCIPHIYRADESPPSYRSGHFLCPAVTYRVPSRVER